MASREIRDLKDKKTKVKFFPKTHTDAVVDNNGNTVTSLLGGKQEKITPANKLDYSLIENAPEGKEQVQSDWNATSGVAFIKNKPSIPSEVTESTVSSWGFVKGVSGKGFSTEDFTTALRTKLEGLSNYDDTDVRGLITGLQNALDTLSGKENVTEAIDTVNEIIAFLDTFKNNDSLASVLATMKSEIEGWVEGKQDLITESNKLDFSLIGNVPEDLGGGYQKPEGGIPASDLAEGVIPTSLPADGGNADTVDNYHIVVGDSAGTAPNTIYVVI